MNRFSFKKAVESALELNARGMEHPSTRAGVVDMIVNYAKRDKRCEEHNRALVCPNCEARKRGKKGAKALHSKTSHETRVEWGKKGGRKAKDVVITKSKDDDIHLRMSNG